MIQELILKLIHLLTVDVTQQMNNHQLVYRALPRLTYLVITL